MLDLGQRGGLDGFKSMVNGLKSMINRHRSMVNGDGRCLPDALVFKLHNPTYVAYCILEN